MGVAEFSHLHLHTQYSLLDGAIRLEDLFPRILERGMKSVAMTDHGNLFGALDFYETAHKYGVKPIFGCETYVAPDRRDRTERKSNHLILLAKDNVGWKNLSYLNSMGYLEGFYYNPRIDKQLLREHSEGLIGLSACLGGEVAQTCMRRGSEAGEAVAREFDDIFGRGKLLPGAAAERAGGAGTGQRSADRDGEEDRHSADRHQRLPLPEPAGRPRARDLDVRAAEEDDSRRQAAAPPQPGVLRQDARRDGRVFRAHPGGDGERRAHRRAVQRHVRSGQHVFAQVQGS